MEVHKPKERAAWTTLFELAGPGRLFDAADARAYRAAIGQARQMNGLMSGFGVRGSQAIAGYHIPYDAKVFAENAASSNKAPECGLPMGVPPASYGAAPDSGFADYARRNPVR